eukprot:8134609-Alexandrium_andersonii.AAC.1
MWPRRLRGRHKPLREGASEPSWRRHPMGAVLRSRMPSHSSVRRCDAVPQVALSDQFCPVCR